MTKELKKTVLRKGDAIDLQTMLEDIIGRLLYRHPTYDDNEDEKSVVRGINVRDSSRGYFIGDADYEIVFRKVKKKTK